MRQELKKFWRNCLKTIERRTEIEQNTAEILKTISLEKLYGRTLLLTGASGLVGTQLVSVLARSGLSRLYIQTRNGLPYEPPSNAKVIYADLSNPNDCARLPYADMIISGANYGQPLRFMADPLLALRSASYGLLALLERCNPGGRFLFLSSSEVYCDSPYTSPFKENEIGGVSPYHPRACYIIGKIYGEAMTYLYRGKGISTVAVRHGISYGPGTRRGDQRSWASFIERAITTGEIILMDSGFARRTFCYMSDAVELILRVFLDGTQPVYNIAGKDTLSIRELAEVIGFITGAKVVIPTGDEGGVEGTPPALCLDASLVEREFRKASFVTAVDGFERTVSWWRYTYYGS